MVVGKDIIMIRQGELRRLHVIQKVLEGVIKQVDAAEMLALSSRQVQRIVKRVKTEGDRGIIHKSRGRPSNRKIPDRVKKTVIQCYQSKYKDFGPTLASEKLLEREGMRISDETLRTWLIETGDWKKSRKKGRHRHWRERKAHCGEMVQPEVAL